MLLKIGIGVICLILIFTAEGKKQCIIDPYEYHWPDQDIICSERVWRNYPSVCDMDIGHYDHAKIETALKDRKSRLEERFLDSIARVYQPEIPYPSIDECAVTTVKGKDADLKVNCKKICPSNFVNVTSVAFNFEGRVWTKCFVVRPWHQLVYFMNCSSQIPDAHGLGSSYKCVPEDLIKRQVALFCPKIGKQCQFTNLTLPQNCGLSNFECKGNKLPMNSMAEANDLMSRLGLPWL